MDTYPLDVDAGQVVRWLIGEERAGHNELHVSASRSYIVESIHVAQRQQRRLGDPAFDEPAVHKQWRTP